MKPTTRTRSMSAKRLRQALNQLADIICREKLFRKSLAHVIKKYDICSDFHLNQATQSPTATAAGLFYGRGCRNSISSVPCGGLMPPLPDSRWKSTGSGTFSVSGDHKPYCFI